MKNLKITRKQILTASIIFAVLLAIFLTAALIRNSKIFKIAFYQIPENVRTQIELQIAGRENSKIKFYVLDGTKPIASNASKKFSIVFAYNSRSLVDLKPKNVSAKTVNFLPAKIRYSTVMHDSENYALPLLLDHFELAVYRTYKNQLELAVPETLDQLTSYLEAVKQKAEFPLIAIGSDDNELFGFVSTFAQSMYGAEKYQKLCAELYKSQASLSELPEDLCRVLDEIKKLQKLGLINPGWVNATKTDIEFLMKEHKLGSLAAFLSTHRSLSYVLVKYYDACIFPQKEVHQEFGVIAPEICAAVFKNESQSQKILSYLISQEVQTELSAKTMLAPSASVAESGDSLSDDVRFWAAASPAGPLPSLKEASFISPERVRSYADKIREYLK
ncbi:MAG: hypothetical protein ACI4LX_04205 [Treponema sp.]